MRWDAELDAPTIVNAGEILQRLAGVKVQHGRKRFIPEGQPPTAVLTVLGVTGAWSGRA